MKTLIIYYSFEGACRFVAERLAAACGADLLELKPAKDIKGGKASKYFWGGRQVVFGTKPELLPLDKDPGDYDLLIMGTPVWAFTYTPAFRTFLSEAGLKGKKIALFYCHEGGPGKTLENMKKALQGNDIIETADFINVNKNRDSLGAVIDAWAGKILERAGENNL